MNYLTELANYIHRYEETFIYLGVILRAGAFLGFLVTIIPKQLREVRVQDDIVLIRRSLLVISLLTEVMFLYSIYLTYCQVVMCGGLYSDGLRVFLYSIGSFLIYVMVHLIYKQKGTSNGAEDKI